MDISIPEEENEYVGVLTDIHIPFTKEKYRKGWI
jgi:hypothetical protein